MDPVTLAAIGIGFDIFGGVQAKRSADKAAEAAKKVGEFNAGIIERDLTILENQRKIINANLLLDENREGIVSQAFKAKPLHLTLLPGLTYLKVRQCVFCARTHESLNTIWR